MHGEGQRRVCPECGQGVVHIEDRLSHGELRGPRNITSSNVDRFFDDGGNRFLFIEEKNPGEGFSVGQKQALQALAKRPENTVWVVKGMPDDLKIWEVEPDGTTTVIQGDGSIWEHYENQIALWFVRGAEGDAA